MTEQEDTRQKSRRDLLLVLLILPFGVLCMFLTGQIAITLAPEWSLNADMRSLLDPNATFAAQGIPALIEPINPQILTQPAWGSLFLTPNAPIPTRLIPSPTSSPVSTPPPPPVPTMQPEEPTATATISGPIILPTSGGPGEADLRIEKSDNSPTYTPGTSINYTILVTNLGPDNVSRFNIVDDIPTVISGLSINCAPADRCGTNTSSGNRVSFTGAALSNGGVITISIRGTVASSATGPLVNTATVTIPSGVRVEDPNSANNTVTDRDTQRSVYDVAITKSDGSDTYTAADPINYIITVTNSGPSDALGITITDAKPPQINSWGWCVSPCTPNPNATNGDLSSTVNISSGANIQYLVSAIPSGISEPIRNTARLIIPSGPGTIVEQNSSNNIATDTDIPYIDLLITKDDGVTAYIPGGTVTYVVTVTNNSTFNLTGLTVSDPKPLQVTTWRWCVGSACTGFINSDFSETIPNLAAGGSLTYTVTANISGTATGDLVNTATVSAPAGLVDAVPANNSATDVDGPNIDLQITKTDVPLGNTYTPGGQLIYEVVVTNNSAVSLTGVTVTDNRPLLIASWFWTCAPGPGASCTQGIGLTDLIDTAVSLPAGGSVTYTITATLHEFAAGPLENTATVSPPAGVVDTVPGNNTATDINVNADGEPDIGPPDGNVYNLPEGRSATFYLSQPIVANGNAAPDFVFYEFPRAPGINLDHIMTEISSDGSIWFPVFYWGNGIADTNANVDINLPNIASACVPPSTEQDNCPISSSDLYNNTGITIDIDSLGLSGSYPWIRFTAPPGSGDAAQIDAIQILP